MSSWSCPHDLNGVCQLVQGAVCDPGMRGCVLHGKVRFAGDGKNAPRKPVLSNVEGPVPNKVGGPVKAEPAPAPAGIPKRRLPF